MRNSDRKLLLPWFSVFTWIMLILSIKMTLAQGPSAAIARSARTEAEMEVRRRNEVSRARASMSRPGVMIMPPRTAFGAAGVPARRTALSSSAQLSKVHGSRTVPPAFSTAARVFQLSSSLFLQRAGREAGATPDGLAGFRGALSDICPVPPICSTFEPYRRADGTCNNLFFPLQGSQSTPQPRHLLAAYENFFDVPRLHGVSGGLLPSPRLVSNVVHRGIGPEVLQLDVTLFLMQWGQFTDHDIVLTPIVVEDDGSDIECCTPIGEPKPIQPEECLYIPILPGDPYFPPVRTCMDFVRSVPAIDSSCVPGQRQQLNRITSYIDASNVYGSTQEKQDLLRGPKIGGRLDDRGLNLPEDITEPCTLTDKGAGIDYCLLAGDVRVMEQSALSMIHTIFMREHNRIADELAKNGWDDEIIFQEARKIVAAEMQHITYNEYLPTLLGDAYMHFFGLYSTSSGFNWVYDHFIDASIVNVFAAATFRYGHSQVPNELGKTPTVEGPPFDIRAFDDLFFRPNMILKPFGADTIARYTATANSHVVDSRIEQSVRNKLFKDVTNPLDSLDLAALNIQRGRDHGLPPYNAYRVLCGRHPYLSWADATDHSPQNVANLQLAYSDPRDIDMFTGALSERPIPGGYIGPTNACILGNQFRRLKLGDRFFYENPFPTTGFSFNQLNNIKTTRLARIICKNTNTGMIQPNVFRKVGPGNPLVSCDSLPDIHFSLWSGPQPLPGHMFHGPSFAPPASPISPLNKPKVPKFMVPKFPTAKH